MRVITLLENTQVPGTSLIAKHGLSLYIETGDMKILFDVGPDDSFIHNAEELKINLSEVNILVLSHAHSDHGGGLREFCKINSKAKIFLRTDGKNKFFSFRDGEYIYIGLDQDILKTYSDRIHYLGKKTEISPRISLLAPRRYGTFLPKSFLYKCEDDNMIKDSLKHELIMVIEERKKDIAHGEKVLNVFTGCSHNGILNMVLTVENEFKNKKIGFLIGGFHLMNPRTGKMLEEESIVNRIAASLYEHQIPKIYTGHCTGSHAFGLLQEVLGQSIQKNLYRNDNRTIRTIIIVIFLIKSDFVKIWFLSW